MFGSRAGHNVTENLICERLATYDQAERVHALRENKEINNGQPLMKSLKKTIVPNLVISGFVSLLDYGLGEKNSSFPLNGLGVVLAASIAASSIITVIGDQMYAQKILENEISEQRFNRLAVKINDLDGQLLNAIGKEHTQLLAAKKYFERTIEKCSLPGPNWRSGSHSE